MIKIYSFDIFDTLLLRPYADPQSLWDVLEDQENEIGFAKARREADKITFRRAISNNGETTIEEVYNLMPKYHHMMAKEMELERKVLTANPEMLDKWNSLKESGERCIIVSDMYLPSDFIKLILKENGIEGWSGFYLSRDYNARKSSGRLFEIMMEKEGVKPNEVFHIGDNMNSDVKIPASLGILTEFYEKRINEFYKEFRFVKYIKPNLVGLLTIGWQQLKKKYIELNYWNKLGFIIGGVLGYFYVKWVVDISRKNGINHLLFVARDGYILKAICEECFKDINAEYFYAPRLVNTIVLGAIGEDPVIIKQKSDYLNNNIIDHISTISNYREYINDFCIDEKTAIVDGCSSHFSAQKLVEYFVQHDVFSFYLLAMSKKKNAASLYSTNSYSLPFQMLSEFILGSPERPIVSVYNRKPFYSDSISAEEEFKMNVSDDLLKGAILSAGVMHKYDYEMSGEEWLSYVDAFMKHLSKNDVKYLSKAKNAPDLEQKAFSDVIYKPLPQKGFYIMKIGKWPRGIGYVKSNINYYVFLSRKGIVKNRKDISIKVNDVIL